MLLGLFWVLFVILTPWLGILVYLIARGRGMQERQLEQASKMQRAQTEYIKSVAGNPSPSAADQITSGLGRERCGREPTLYSTHSEARN